MVDRKTEREENADINTSAETQEDKKTHGLVNLKSISNTY